MKLITSKNRKQLLKNTALIKTTPDYNPKPVVRLFTLFRPCEWLLTHLDPEDEDIAWGLCDLGMGCPEFGSVSLSELAALKVAMGIPMVERDKFFKPRATIRKYQAEALIERRIIP